MATAASEARQEAQVRRRFRIRGTVQGVGFRPFVWHAATALGLTGWVRNTADGVTVEAEGAPDALRALEAALRDPAPHHARVAEVTVDTMGSEGSNTFEVLDSDASGSRDLHVLADIATCGACLAEMADPSDRRYRYPFINCTDCGPRHSIIEDLPYDRANTAMRGFPLCPQCQAEYEEPANRRFHAEPNACPVCGPQLSLLDPSGAPIAERESAFQKAVAALRDGRIVAVKGIGGFHLLADARNETAVRRLRTRKRRVDKPFAVMFPSLDAVRDHCRLDAVAEAALIGAARPIVLLARTGRPLAPSVAPDNPRLGALLPYTPLHHLLIAELGFPLVATSGNLSEEPIVRDDGEALSRLHTVADLFLTHDRPIVRPVEDSVVQIVCGEPQLLRRGRGYGPLAGNPCGLRSGILAVGGHLKTTVALTGNDAILSSPHVGDLETAEARRAHTAAAADLIRLHGIDARLAVRDLHPDYASGRTAERSGLPVVAVQHHVAHAAGCLAEHGLTPPALAIVWDGSGYGPDGTVWGGEALHLTPTGWTRVARLRPFPLPGGEAAVREPRRSALGLLHAAYGGACLAVPDLPPVAAFDPTERSVLATALARGVNAPLTSSIGRLFDAIAGLCGLGQRSDYEGQTAAALEAAAGSGRSPRAYDFPIRETAGEPGLEIDWAPALDAIIADLRDGRAVPEIAAALHDGLAAAILALARRIGEPQVALTGGCFQNVRLTETAVNALRAAGFEPIWHREIPPNDGGLAYGQAAWAGWMEERETKPCA